MALTAKTIKTFCFAEGHLWLIFLSITGVISLGLERTIWVYVVGPVSNSQIYCVVPGIFVIAGTGVALTAFPYSSNTAIFLCRCVVFVLSAIVYIVAVAIFCDYMPILCSAAGCDPASSMACPRNYGLTASVDDRLTKISADGPSLIVPNSYPYNYRIKMNAVLKVTAFLVELVGICVANAATVLTVLEFIRLRKRHPESVLVLTTITDGSAADPNHEVKKTTANGQRLAIINSNAWMVSIQERLPGSIEHVHICSGSLISERLVLTAPSCLFEGQTVFKKRSRRELSVVIRSDGMSAFRIPVLDMDISSSAANLKPYVTQNMLQNDVAIIILWESINKISDEFLKRIAFIDLPSNQTDFFPSCRFYLCLLPLWTFAPNERKPNSTWGTSVHTASVAPHVANLAILTNYSACQALWGNGTIITGHMLCTNGEMDTCERNFGGPLVETFYDYEANLLKGSHYRNKYYPEQYVLRLKLNTPKAHFINMIFLCRACAPGTVVVSAFVRINLFTPWINWIMKRFK